MRLIFLRGICGDTRTCPDINASDRGTYVVQGHVVTCLDPDTLVLAPGESVVEVPSSLLPELADHEAAHDAIRRTAHGTVLVRGRTLVDSEALRELNLPTGEAAVEIPVSTLPELEITHAG